MSNNIRSKVAERCFHCFDADREKLMPSMDQTARHWTNHSPTSSTNGQRSSTRLQQHFYYLSKWKAERRPIK